MANNVQDYYRLLGVSREASEREVKQAYYEAARRLHPDKAKSKEEADANANQLAAISKAYNTLKDPAKREAYDQQIRGKSPAAGGATAPPKGSPAPPRTPPSSAGRAVQDASNDSVRREYSASDAMSHKRVIAQKAFVKGMQFYKKQDHRQALGFFEAAVTNDPESEPQYHIKYAQSLIKTKGSFTKAVHHAEVACQMDPYNLDFKMILAQINETAGVTSRAREIYQDVLRWDSEHQGAKLALQMLGKQGSGPGGKQTFKEKLAAFWEAANKKR